MREGIAGATEGSSIAVINSLLSMLGHCGRRTPSLTRRGTRPTDQLPKKKAPLARKGCDVVVGDDLNLAVVSR